MDPPEERKDSEQSWTIAHNRIERRVARFARDAAIGLTREARETKRFHQGLAGRDDPGPDAVIDAGIDWLLRAQRDNASGDAGFASSYALGRGWGRSYPETTGYIISTLLDPDVLSRRPESRAAANDAADWLLSIQTPSGGWAGSVVGASHEPVTFNTGQILIGLSDVIRTLGRDDRAEVRHACEWLVSMQDEDGAWRRGHSRFAIPGPSTYELHTSWGLLAAAEALDEPSFKAAALRQADWALGQQQENGWFARCDLTDGARPLTHTIAYAVRGLIEAWRHSQDRRYLDAAVRTSSALATLTDETGFLAGRLSSDWSAAVEWACVTGTSQMAICWGLLYEQTRDTSFRAALRRANAFVRKTVRLEGGDALRGGAPGSYPIDGGYCRYELLNWATKFTVDAQLAELRLGV
jgi:hypothetical protein